MKAEEQKLLHAVTKDFNLDMPAGSSKEELTAHLAAYINHLINTDFEKLVFYLYRIDVDESKMKQLLQQKQNENAGELIAQLIIDRQLQKIKSRREFKQRDDTIHEEDKW